MYLIKQGGDERWHFGHSSRSCSDFGDQCRTGKSDGLYQAHFAKRPSTSITGRPGMQQLFLAILRTLSHQLSSSICVACLHVPQPRRLQSGRQHACALEILTLDLSPSKPWVLFTNRTIILY